MKVLEIKLVFSYFLFQFLGLHFIKLCLRLFNQRCNITHTQDALRHAFRVKNIERIKLFAVAAILGALWEYGSSLACDGYGQPFFSPVWQITSYLPIANLAVNIPLYILVFSLGRTFSMREDDPASDAVDPEENAS